MSSVVCGKKSEVYQVLLRMSEQEGQNAVRPGQGVGYAPPREAHT